MDESQNSYSDWRHQTNKQIKSTYVCFKMDKISRKANEFIVTKQISDALGWGGRRDYTKVVGKHLGR